MLRRTNTVPLDYGLCCMTVTVYRREGLTRHVLRNAHYELTDELRHSAGVTQYGRPFLLVIPGQADLAVGDKVLLGEGPEVIAWDELNIAKFPTLGVVQSVKPRYFRGRLCHMEARGNG